MINPWKTIKQNIVYDNPKFGYKLREDDVVTPSGVPGKYMVLEGLYHSLVVAITTKGNVLINHQWRYPPETDSYEIIGETSEPNESPLETAKRGLLEEMSVEAKEWYRLGSHWMGIGIAKMQGHIFLATGIEETGLKSEPEKEILLVKFNKAIDMVMSEEIISSETKLPLLLAKEYIKRNNLII